MRKRFASVICCVICAAVLAGCAHAEKEMPTEMPIETVKAEDNKPALPEKLKPGKDGVPMLSVYQVDEETVTDMDLETYLEGVLAGEMKNNWPLEALKAQAILARTFVLKFCTEKESKYQGADISTDIEEAQAYDATGVNNRIKKAVRETRGLILSHQGELPYAWFHAHSGGVTAKAREGLGYDDEEPGYTQVVKGMDSEDAPPEAKGWEAAFTKEEVIAAAKTCGVRIDSVDDIEVGDTGESGRAETIVINGKSVSAPELRIALGSTKMRSTLLSSLKIENGQIRMAGRGYGHGVGMTQWGAYAMAEEGKSAEEIVTYYFKDVTVEKMW